MLNKYRILEDEQIVFLNKNNFNLDIEPDRLMDAIGDFLTLECLDDDYMPNPNGIMCENILDKLAEME